jgi:hypothetical protein
MSYCSSCGKHHNVGFISTRFAGTDGVSLETAKWANVFENILLKKPIFETPTSKIFSVTASAPACGVAL